MRLFQHIDRWFGRLFVGRLVRFGLNDPKTHMMSGDILYRYIYSQHKRIYRRYAVTYEQIKAMVEKAKKKENQGFTTKLVLSKARTTIQRAIRDKRIIFKEYDEIEYTDKRGKKEVLTFNQLAVKFMDLVGQRDNMAIYFGIKDSHIKDILIEEYKRRN